MELKCGGVRVFLSEISDRSISPQSPPVDLNYLATNGYLSVMPKDEYDRGSTEVTTLTQLNQELDRERMEASLAAGEWREDVKKTQSILFHFEGKEKRDAQIAHTGQEREEAVKEQADVVQKESQIAELIQKKSRMDRMVQYDGGYASLTGLGVVTLNDLNVRNYRVSDTEFSDFIDETRETSRELRSIAERGSYHVSNLMAGFPNEDVSHLWSVSVGLAKLEGDPRQIGDRFLFSLGVLQHLHSTLDNKMAAAEVMTSVKGDPSLSPSDNSDLQNASKALENLDHELRHHEKVPEQLSASVAAMMMFGKRFDGTYPTDKFASFSRMTKSFDSAAILSIVNVPLDQLSVRFQAFRSMFNAWGYRTSEDTELASAYLAISDQGPSDVTTKLTIILSALRNYLEYPLVASAILTSIPTLEANETLDLMEKTFSILASYAIGLERSELISLSVRMIHGIKNALVRQLDPTARIMNTPVQFMHAPSLIFFPYRAPLIIAHHSYFSTYSGLGGYHPAHVHGFGGGFGG